jgi:hypothetical protein
MEGDKINVPGFSKLGTVVHEVTTDPTIIVQFEKVTIFVDKKTRKIRLPKNCVAILD